MQAVAPYERPALTKGYLFPLDKKPARLPGFHTCVGSGGDRQDPEWYQKHGIEVLYEDPVISFDSNTQTVATSSGKTLKYGSLIISTGCGSARFPEKIGGNLPGVHYIRDVADADSLISSLQKSKKVVIIGGGYIGMEVAAATTGWNLDTTVIFPEDHIMSRLFTPSIAHRYEELYESKGVKIMKDYLIIASMASAFLGRMASSISSSYSHYALKHRVVGAPRISRRSFAVSASKLSNDNREFVIVGGGNAAGYAARTFVEHGMADGRLCIVTKEAVAPYERPALTKGYLFPLDKKPARLPGFHTCVGSGGDRQDPEWYQKHGIEVLYEDPVISFDSNTQTVATSSGKTLKYGSLIISTGCGSARFPEKIGGNLPGVHYIRDVADADSLISSLQKSKKVVIIGGGYIGMEVAAATTGWNLDTTVIFPEDHIMSRLFTPSIAHRYEELYESKGVKIMKGSLIEKLEAGADGRVANVVLKNGSVVEADTVIVGIGAKPAVSPFEAVGLNTSVGGIQVDSLFRSNVPGIFAIGDVAAFPLKIYNRMARVEHVDHARKSAQHCVKSLLTAYTEPYDYLPYFYSRVFEYEGSTRKVWWQFYGDNVGDTVEIGNFDPKLATFWIDSDSRLKGVFLESGTSEEFSLLPQLARSQPVVDKAKLKSASSVEDALEIARNSL